MKINRKTTCKPSNKECDILPSKMSSLKSMGTTVVCHNHTEVISYQQPKGDD